MLRVARSRTSATYVDLLGVVERGHPVSQQCLKKSNYLFANLAANET
jgi:hypothetical protein